jgi:hypothetical protein
MADPTRSAGRWKAKGNLERVDETLNAPREDIAKNYEGTPTRVFAPWLRASV